MNSDQAHITKATLIYLQRVSCCLHSFLRSPGLPPSAATTGDFARYGHDRRDGYGYGHDLELIPELDPEFDPEFDPDFDRHAKGNGTLPISPMGGPGASLSANPRLVLCESPQGRGIVPGGPTPST